MFVGDIGQAEDAAQIQQNIVRINGQRSVYVPVLKQSGANTIAIVDGVEEVLPKITGIPKALKLKAIFSQATYVRNAIEALEHEAVLGSVLASLMILIFLGSFRSTLAIFLSIPLSILAARSACCYWRDGQYHDPGRLRTGDRPAGGRLDRRAGEHQSPSGRRRRAANSCANGAPRRSRCRCWLRPSRPSSCFFR